jgi:hypothetical protein
MLVRLVDAIFFYMDENCPIPGLRGTQHIEPAKYCWFSRITGADEETVGILLPRRVS